MSSPRQRLEVRGRLSHASATKDKPTRHRHGPRGTTWAEMIGTGCPLTTAVKLERTDGRLVFDEAVDQEDETDHMGKISADAARGKESSGG